MLAEYHQRVCTRRVYRYEKLYLQKLSPIIPMDKLRAVAKRIWRAEFGSLDSLPKITAGRGMFYLGKWCSYCDMANENRIVLVPRHRRVTVLVHELTHAMGCGYHDEKFVDVFFYLLETYCGFTYLELDINAAFFGVRR